MLREQSPQPYIIRDSTPEKESTPVPFMLLSERSRRPLSTNDVLPFHIPQHLHDSMGLENLTISFHAHGFPTFYSYEKPASPVACIAMCTHTSQLVLNWGQYINTMSNEPYMSVSALPTLIRKNHDGTWWFWNKTSGLYFDETLTSLVGQGWELTFTGSQVV